MSFKGTFVLAILVVIGATVWFTTDDGRGGEFVEKTVGAKQTELLKEPPAIAQVAAITLTKRDGEALAFARSVPEADDAEGQPGPWGMTAPVGSGAEQWVVTQLPKTLLELKSKRSFAPGEGEATLAEAGLDAPRLAVGLVTPAGQYTFAIGNKVPVSNDTYVLVKDLDGSERVHVVTHDFKPDIDRRMEEYRSKSLFPRQRGSANYVAMTNGDKRVTLAEGPGGWMLENPMRAFADGRRVTEVISSIWTLRATEFIDDAPTDLGKYGLATPEMTLTLRTVDGEQFGVQVGEFADLEKSTRYFKLADRDWVGSIRTDSLTPLTLEANFLRDGQVVRLDPGSIAKLELVPAGSEAVELNRVRGEWSGTGTLKQVELSAVSDLVRGLTDLRAIDFVDQPKDLGKYGLDVPRMVIRVTSSDAGQATEVRIGGRTPSERNTYLQVDDQDTVLVVATSKINQLAVDPGTLRSRKIFALRVDDILAIESTMMNSRRVLRLIEDGWWLEKPDGAQIDAVALRDLVNSIALLRASAVVAGKDVDALGTLQPVGSLRITVNEEAEQGGEHVLRLSQRGDQSFCVVDDLPYVFRLDPTVSETLTAELVSRRLLSIDADAVESITLTDANASLQFSRSGEDWAFALDSSVKLDPLKINTMVERITSLDVKRYLTFNDGRGSDAGFSDPAAGIVIQTSDETFTLQFGPDIPGEGGRFGLWVEPGRVFQAGSAAFEAFSTDLEQFAAE